jgi:hypothetical protein
MSTRVRPGHIVRVTVRQLDDLKAQNRIVADQYVVIGSCVHPIRVIRDRAAPLPRIPS